MLTSRDGDVSDSVWGELYRARRSLKNTRNFQVWLQNIITEVYLVMCEIYAWKFVKRISGTELENEGFTD